MVTSKNKEYTEFPLSLIRRSNFLQSSLITSRKNSQVFSAYESVYLYQFKSELEIKSM